MTKAVQGALRLDKKFDIIANHLANTSTAGYKAETLSFDDVFQARMRIDMSQGSVHPSGNPLDLAITGDGFFKVQTPNGDRYTRNGTFLLDKDQYLITQEGYRVLGEDGPLNLDGEAVTVSDNGDVHVDGTPVGTLKIVTFSAPELLEKQGTGLFLYNGDIADERVPEQLSVQQFALEQSNVAVVTEMADMITTSRLFESFQKLIQSYDEMDAKAVGDVGLVR